MAWIRSSRRCDAAGLGLHGFQSGELQFAEEAQQVQTGAGDPPGAVTRQAPEQARAASASANNSPQPAKQADADTQPPQIMTDQSAFLASLQAAHAIVEAGRVETAKVREELVAEKTKTMEANAKTMAEMIKRLEAGKAAIEAKNASLQVTTDAAKAAKDAAEAARPPGTTAKKCVA